MIRKITHKAIQTLRKVHYPQKSPFLAQNIRRNISLKNLKIKSDPFKVCKDPSLNNQSFDYAVIGGGSGGISSAIKASQLGLKTVIFDFVEASPHGSKWGLGGTCVNVGCVPKKLIHHASLLKEASLLAPSYGLDLGPQENHSFSWSTLIKNIGLYIKRTNYDMTQGLQGDNI